jgi:hypothetical protein
MLALLELSDDEDGELLVSTGWCNGAHSTGVNGITE